MTLPLDSSIDAMVAGPFVTAVIVPFLWRLLGERAAWLAALVPAASFALLASLVSTIASGGVVAASIPWLPAYGISLAFRLDGLSMLFSLAISGIGALVLLYSAAYLRGDPRQGSFFAFMLAFMGAMQGLVLADSLVALFCFWELTAVTSFLLIGFDHTRTAARRAAIQALVVTSAGGLCLLLGIVLLHVLGGEWELSGLAAHREALLASGLAGPMTLLLVAAAFTKSAQLPVHFWLPNAMEAPTPVSAYLHSATMVQAGIYLLARLSPLLGGTALWVTVLSAFGGATLLWGAAGALRQSDLKQVLAHSTVASLGLLVLLLGVGGEAAALAAVAYFAAHALYKAGLFLVVGLIDHETGVRDLTALAGLREKMALAFIAAALAGFSMFGLPPAMGYLAKEASYAAIGGPGWSELLLPTVLVLGNAAMGAVALALALAPFLGPEIATPKRPHEGPVEMLAGPLLLGLCGIGLAVLIGWSGPQLLLPAATAIVGGAVHVHVGFEVSIADPALWLSLLTWALSAALFWRLGALRTLLRRLEAGARLSFDRAFDLGLAGLLGLAEIGSRNWQNGRLRFYVLVLTLAAAAALILPLLILGGLPALPSSPAPEPLEWAVAGLALVGLIGVVAAPTLLIGILALGVQGLAVALIYLLFGAPDLGFTQFMVETLSVVMFALVMTRLRLGLPAHRPRVAAIRDAVVALLCGAGVTGVLLAVLDQPFNSRLADFFTANAAALAHGRNVVNVILVDFRGLDTLGEIAVVMTAGVAVLALVASGGKPKPAPRVRKPRRARGGPASEAAP